jgi:hypothetical protein
MTLFCAAAGLPCHLKRPLPRASNGGMAYLTDAEEEQRVA